MKFYTYKKVANAHKAAWQKLRFLAGKGYYPIGKKPTPPVVLPQFTMYDSVTISEIPANAEAVAGYVNGRYRTWPQIVTDFPHAKKLSIAVTADADAECLDVEKGDADPTQAPAWVKYQMRWGAKRPVVYCSVSQAKGVLDTLARAGISRSMIRLWTAHYTYAPHRCNAACGFGFTGQADATQYSDHALGRNLDASLCAPNFL